MPKPRPPGDRALGAPPIDPMTIVRAIVAGACVLAAATALVGLVTSL